MKCPDCKRVMAVDYQLKEATGVFTWWKCSKCDRVILVKDKKENEQAVDYQENQDRKGGVTMAKVILIYGSTMGNTEALSQPVARGLASRGAEVIVKRVEEASVDEMQDFEGIVLGCSTWGDGEFQDDFIQFAEAMKSVDLTGKKAAVFGPGESEYPQFCKAVDLLEEQLKACGAEIALESMKIDGDVEPHFKEAENWGSKVAESL